jgi:glycosyltransferase involved in cell wall biosynthesis
MKTHIESLREELSKKHEVKILCQDDFKNINIYSGMYYVNLLGIKKIGEALEWCDIMHVHLPSFSFEFILPLLKSSKPVVCTFHFSLGDSSLIYNLKAKILNFIAKNMMYALGKAYSKRSSRFIVVGNTQKNILAGIKDPVVINNCVPIDKFKKIKAKRYFKGFSVGYLGRVDPEKNVEKLINACKELKVNLAVAGLGTEYDRLKKKYNSRSIKFCGRQDYPPVRFYNGIDVFCSPSFIEANISLTVIEAMACGKPVIVCGCGGEEKNIKKTFGLVSKPDKESIKSSIINIRSMNLRKMSANARKEAIQNYNLKNMIKKIESIYKEAIIETY